MELSSDEEMMLVEDSQVAPSHEAPEEHAPTPTWSDEPVVPETPRPPRRRAPRFRINRKKIGLTYACPVGMDKNPIGSCEELQAAIEAVVGMGIWIIAEEMHQDDDGNEHPTRNHFHVYYAADAKMNITSQRAFDVCGVHPRIESASPGHGWINYVAGEGSHSEKKQVRVIDNRKKSAWALALKAPTVAAANAILVEAHPRDVLLHGRSITANLQDRLYSAPVRRCFNGPYRELKMAVGKSTWWEGPPGMGKTEAAHYLMRHLTGSVPEEPQKYLYVKGTLSALKHLKAWHQGIIFDDVQIPEEWGIFHWNTLFDINDEGSLPARYGDVHVPAGMIKLFICNGNMMSPPSHESVTRRVEKYAVDRDYEFSPITLY